MTKPASQLSLFFRAQVRPPLEGSKLLAAKFRIHPISDCSEHLFAAMAGASFAFAVPDAASELLLRLVASFAGSSSELNITVVDGTSTVEFADAKGEKLQGLTTACIAIANSSPLAAQLVGATPELQAKVCSRYMQYKCTSALPITAKY